MLLLPTLCFGFVFLCFFVYITSYFKILRIALFNSLAFKFKDAITPAQYRLNLPLFLGASKAIVLGLSRFILNVALIGQTILGICFLVQCVWWGSHITGPLCFIYAVPDSFSFSLVGLTLFIFFLCFVLLFKEEHRNLALWCGILFMLEGFLLLAFLTDNILVFYVSFEATLLPMYLLIGCWGSRSRKIKANYYFFLYTLLGSLFTLVGLILLYRGTGTFSFTALALHMGTPQGLERCFGSTIIPVLWILLSIGFLFKLPLFVFHLWLPEAHVEAPTIGSIILAALLLKLGVYGFVRLPFSFFPSGTSFWLPWLLPFILLGFFYPSAVAVVHDDMKKIIAYSSVAHMAGVLLGFLTHTIEGVTGAMFLSIGHGVVSGGLFAVVGLLYDRHKTRDIKYFGGLAQLMPLVCFFFLFLTFGNMGFPFLCNFPGELLILFSTVDRFPIAVVFFGFGFFLTAVYSLRLVNIIMSGSSKTFSFSSLYDAERNEYYVLFSFCAAAAGLGLLAAPLIQSFSPLASIYLGV